MHYVYINNQLQIQYTLHQIVLVYRIHFLCQPENITNNVIRWKRANEEKTINETFGNN